MYFKPNINGGLLSLATDGKAKIIIQIPWIKIHGYKRIEPTALMREKSRRLGSFVTIGFNLWNLPLHNQNLFRR
jgi:hypothetical protein